MRFKLFVVPLVTVSLFAAVLPAFSQVAPEYSGRTLPLYVGFGPSGYDVDWGHGRMYGGTIWADWYPAQLPRILHGLGVEVEARDISLHQNCNPANFCPQKNLREDSAGGGVIYSWRHFRNFHPFGKFLIEDGSVDHYLYVVPPPAGPHDQSHAKLTVLTPGLGFEYRIFGPLWARVDYEYQDWGTLLGKTLNPQGFTVGVSYAFEHAHSH